MPLTIRRRAYAIGASLVLALPLAATAAPAEAKAKAKRTYAITWQSNEASSEDQAIYHCVRRNQIVGSAHVVDRADATRFTCRYNKKTDWPYGVVVYQPAGRRVVVKAGAKVVQDHAPQSRGRDVWVVQGNPTGWWRTSIT